VKLISELLTSVGNTSREALISKEPTKIVEKLSVNSRCNRVYKKRNYNPKKVISTPVAIPMQTVKNSDSFTLYNKTSTGL
jgi:hypothetical protein